MAEATDGALTGKKPPLVSSNMFILPINAKKKNLLTVESKRSSLQQIDSLVAADGSRDKKKIKKKERKKNGFQ